MWPNPTHSTLSGLTKFIPSTVLPMMFCVSVCVVVVVVGGEGGGGGGSFLLYIRTLWLPWPLCWSLHRGRNSCTPPKGQRSRGGAGADRTLKKKKRVALKYSQHTAKVVSRDLIYLKSPSQETLYMSNRYCIASPPPPPPPPPPPKLSAGW